MSVQLSSVSPGAKLPTKESTLNREKDKSSHQHMGGKDWRLFIYGGFSSCAAELGTFPLDTTKTRLQIQGQKVDSRHSAVRYNGMFHALFRITKEEGFRALYSGIAPAVLRQATYGSLKFGIYYSVKGLLVKHGREESLGMNVVCGVIAGTLASTVANPTDVLKVRMQACSRSMQQKTVTQCFYDIYRREGVAGLWRGVGPTAQRAAVITAVELPIYDMSKRYLIEEGFAGDTAYNHLLSSLISSLGGAVATTPIDVVRVRLMNQRRLKMSADVAPECGAASLPRVRLYSGTIDCLVQTVRHEGVMALYKGFVPTWLRMGPWNVIFFLSYEQLKKLY